MGKPHTVAFWQSDGFHRWVRAHIGPVRM